MISLQGKGGQYQGKEGEKNGGSHVQRKQYRIHDAARHKRKETRTCDTAEIDPLHNAPVNIDLPAPRGHNRPRTSGQNQYRQNMDRAETPQQVYLMNEETRHGGYRHERDPNAAQHLVQARPLAAKENDSADDRGWNDGGDMELNGQWRSGKRFEIHLKAPVEFRPAFNKTALPSNEMASNAG
ncbi:hypothetical protein FHS76_002494 [Ochrobactrum daejeonense]|uniref:Uncharacterized protein n=1 Tax=Brucella daejeonensis TaxID=659015 RepID=A0A7W9AXV8_9HYPH|nr:hypothetical protein [Brucella daejeonensis]